MLRKKGSETYTPACGLLGRPHKRGSDLGHGAEDAAGLWERAATENTVRDSLFAGAHRARRQAVNSGGAKRPRPRCMRLCAAGAAQDAPAA